MRHLADIAAREQLLEDRFLIRHGHSRVILERLHGHLPALEPSPFDHAVEDFDLSPHLALIARAARYRNATVVLIDANDLRGNVREHLVEELPV